MVANGSLELASMDVVEWMSVRPWFFEVIDLKATIRWYPGPVSLVYMSLVVACTMMVEWD